MKIKTLIKELQKLDKEQEIKLYPKYVVEEETYASRVFKKRYINEQERDGVEYVAIIF